MEHDQDGGKTPEFDSQVAAAKSIPAKKPYVAPVLVKYGTIAKLTQGTFTRNPDGGNTLQKMGACL